MSHNKYKDKKVIVLGYGRSGRSAVNTMIRFGANVVLTTNEIFADESVTYKRVRPRAQGRMYKRFKRTSHLTVKLTRN